MNRPNINNYYDYVLTCIPPIRVTKEKQYIDDLEKYCDKLEKALDKACRRIVELEIIEDLEGNKIFNLDKEDIKKWCIQEKSCNGCGNYYDREICNDCIDYSRWCAEDE